MKTKNRFWLCPLIVTGLVLILTHSCKKDEEPSDKITDIDGNVYTSVTIGTQTWMVENLRVTKYRNGDPIANITNQMEWDGLSSGAYCFYNNDEPQYKMTYGALYNWYAVNDSRKIAPVGWHVPTDAEWKTFENYLIANGYNYDGTTTGNKIGKALASTTLWLSSQAQGAIGNIDYPTYRNKTGFTALPASVRNFGVGFGNLGYAALWWCATELNATNALIRFLSMDSNFLASGDTGKTLGLSVRCVKD